MQGAATPTAQPGATDVYALGQDAAESARTFLAWGRKPSSADGKG
jgi:hypothetical protein